MTDDFEARARLAGERVRRRAHELLDGDDQIDGRDQIDVVAAPPRHTSRWVVAVVAAAVLLVAVVAVAAPRRHRAASGTNQAAPVATATPSTATPTTPVTSTTVAAATAPGTTSSATTIAPAGIRRPIVDPGVCRPLGTAAGATDHAGLRPFLWPRQEATFPIQVIGDPAAGPTGVFVILERFFAPPQKPVGGTIVDIGGNAVSIQSFATSGNVVASWTLPDGSNAYARGRDIDADTMAAVIADLTPRDVSAPIPGFDVAPVSDTLQLVAEQLNIASGAYVTLACESPTTGYRYNVTAITGDPIYRYVSVLDRVRPASVGLVDGTLVLVAGPAVESAPSIADVRNASPAEWDALPADEHGLAPIPGGT